jgi:hypothetical protein
MGTILKHLSNSFLVKALLLLFGALYCGGSLKALSFFYPLTLLMMIYQMPVLLTAGIIICVYDIQPHQISHKRAMGAACVAGLTFLAVTYLYVTASCYLSKIMHITPLMGRAHYIVFFIALFFFASRWVLRGSKMNITIIRLVVLIIAFYLLAVLPVVDYGLFFSLDPSYPIETYLMQRIPYGGSITTAFYDFFSLFLWWLLTAACIWCFRAKPSGLIPRL